MRILSWVLIFFVSLTAQAIEFQQLLQTDTRDWVDELLVHQGRLYVADGYWRDNSARENHIHVLNIKTRKLMHTIPMDYFISGMTAYQDRLFVATGQEPVLDVVDTKKLRVEFSINLDPTLLSSTCIAEDDGRLYVADAGYRKIQPYDASFLRRYSSFSTGEAEGDGSPWRISASKGKLVMISTLSVMSPMLNTLRVLDAHRGTELAQFDGVVDGFLPRAYNAVFKHSDGFVYATAPFVYEATEPHAELPGSAVVVLNPDLPTQPQVMRLQEAWFPVAMASLGRYLLVLDRGSLDDTKKSLIWVLDPANAEQPIVKRIDLSVVSGGVIQVARGIATSPEGEVFVDSVGAVSVLSGLLD